VKVARYEVLGQRSQRTIRPGLSAIVRTTKEERDDRRMLAIAELRARPKAGHFYRPLRRHFEVVIDLTLGSGSGWRLSEKEVERKTVGLGSCELVFELAKAR